MCVHVSDAVTRVLLKRSLKISQRGSRAGPTTAFGRSGKI